MPQEFHVLRCYNCEKFQVHQTKKAKKWQCKVCGEKQSLKKAYFIGSARDCRLHVQQLNFQDGERKLNCTFDENNLCLDNFEDCSSILSEPTDIANVNSQDDCENYIDECFRHISEESYTSVTEQDSEYLPKKKQRCSRIEVNDESGSIFSNIFKECKNKASESRGQNEEDPFILHEQGISFDVTFSSRPSSEVSDAVFTNKSTCSLEPNKQKSLTVELDVARRKPTAPKNRGFQLIMNAAKKLDLEFS